MKIESYRSMKREIQELKYYIANLSDDDRLVGNSVINDYRSGYPVPQSVVGTDRKKYERIIKQYNEQIKRLEEECLDIEEYIESIEDSETRRIFRMYYIKGMSQKEIGKVMNMDRSTVSRIISKQTKSMEGT